MDPSSRFNQYQLTANLVSPLPPINDVLDLACSACQDLIFFPIPCSATHCWEFATNCDGGIYIMETGKYYKSSPPSLSHLRAGEPVVKELPDYPLLPLLPHWILLEHHIILFQWVHLKY